MSLASFAPPLAQSLISAAGFSVTFSRTTLGAYDPVSNTTMPSTTVSWSGIAIVGKNVRRTEPTVAQSSGTGQRSTTQTLLVAGLGLSLAPQPGDLVTFGGVTYRVGAMYDIGVDLGTTPAYRVEVSL